MSQRRGSKSAAFNAREQDGRSIRIEIVAKSPADGYTLLIVAAAHSINPSLYAKVNYHPTRDFAPISMAVSFPFLLVVHPAIPAQNVNELIAVAKSRPGKLTFASSGSGNTNHLAGELLKSMAGIDITHIPYKGDAPALTDVVGGQVSMMFGTVLESLAKTNRLVIAEEGWPTCSIASEIAAVCMEDGFDLLDAPVLRVCNEDVPLPYAANLEAQALIDAPRIVAAAKKVCYRG